MKQVQRSTTLSTEQPDTTQRTRPRRFLFSLLIGGAITILLTLIEVGFVLLLNPFHVLGDIQNRFFTLLMLPLHMSISLLGLLCDLLVASMGTFLLTQPLVLMSYLRAVYRAQETYHKLYIPLTAVANIRNYQEYPPIPTLNRQDEQISILDLVQLEGSHQLILGVPGAGKTTALRVYQYVAAESRLSLIFSHRRIPVYIPMKNYSLFLKQQFPLEQGHALDDLPPVTLFSYLQDCDLPSMRHLKPYLQKLSDQGRLLLLCDGLNEIDSNYLPLVSKELVYLMRETQNRLVMTCREVDYREQPDFVQLVEEGQAMCAVIYPLQHEQIHEFVELYVQKQDKQWQHTAGQILQVIDRSRLRYHCTNPMMLFTLMGIIDRIGVERGKQIDTRGRLLREYVRLLIDYEGQQAKWSRGAPTEQEIINFLSNVACAARWANDRNAIQLHITSLLLASDTQVRKRMDFQELADELRFWLDEHPAQGPFVVDEDETVEPSVLNDELPQEDLLQVLRFALSATLIEISPSGVLSFRHELIAEYFVAEYFFRATNKIQTFKQGLSVSMRSELLENVGRWSEPVAIWAGLLDNPLNLAERFGVLGLDNPGYILQALTLGLVCVGVLWTPPLIEVQQTVILPASLGEALSIAVRNKAAREELACIFTRCAEEGGQEVYRSLLPLITVEGIDELLILLDHAIAPGTCSNAR